MRHRVGAGVLAVSLALAAAAPVAAVREQQCNGGFQPIHLYTGWEAGDGVPASGVDAWWDMTVAAIAQEGLTVEEVAAQFGFEGDVAGFYELVLTGIHESDNNGNAEVCFRPFPQQQNGTPLYYFKVLDDKLT